MKNNLGKRVVTEHGLISNVLSGLHLVDQIAIAGICYRTYKKTVPWNVVALKTCQESAINGFPEIDVISGDFVCRWIEATIDQEQGHFYGPVSRLTNLPSGYGVFVTKKWIHCGEVIENSFSGRLKVSVFKTYCELKVLQ